MQSTILFILKALEGRGAERMVTTLARTYADLDYRVHIICLEHTQDMPLDQRINYHVIPFDQIFTGSNVTDNVEQVVAYKEVAQRIDRYVVDNIGKPDLILANIYKINWIMSYSQLPNIVNVLHTALSKQFQEQLSRIPEDTIRHLKMIYGAHPCSCVSDGAHQDLLTIIGTNHKVTTIYNPCDVDAIKKLASSKQRDQFGLTPKKYLIHVASFDTMKGHRELLQAYAQTTKTWPLVLVGKGGLEDEIKQLAIQLDISASVKFLGFQANPYPLIASAGLLVVASKFEGFGYTIVEAQALGVPVISTDCPFGPRELLPEKNLVPVDDIKGLTQIIDKAYLSPSSYITSVNQKLLPKHIAQQYLNFVSKL